MSPVAGILTAATMFALLPAWIVWEAASGAWAAVAWAVCAGAVVLYGLRRAEH